MDGLSDVAAVYLATRPRAPSQSVAAGGARQGRRCEVCVGGLAQDMFRSRMGSLNPFKQKLDGMDDDEPDLPVPTPAFMLESLTDISVVSADGTLHTKPPPAINDVIEMTISKIILIIILVVLAWGTLIMQSAPEARYQERALQGLNQLHYQYGNSSAAFQQSVAVYASSKNNDFQLYEANTTDCDAASDAISVDDPSLLYLKVNGEVHSSYSEEDAVSSLRHLELLFVGLNREVDQASGVTTYVQCRVDESIGPAETAFKCDSAAVFDLRDYSKRMATNYLLQVAPILLMGTAILAMMLIGMINTMFEPII
ncbi:hypothetical protein CYMTET_26043, partial [Cymbomonas tetramitiformis]